MYKEVWGQNSRLYLHCSKLRVLGIQLESDYSSQNNYWKILV